MEFLWDVCEAEEVTLRSGSCLEFRNLQDRLQEVSSQSALLQYVGTDCTEESFALVEL